MSLGAILLIVLILMLLSAIPTWPHSRNWGYAPGSLSDFGITGCKTTAADHFSPLSWAIVRLFPGETDKNWPRWGRFSLSTTKIRQAASGGLGVAGHRRHRAAVTGPAVTNRARIAHRRAWPCWNAPLLGVVMVALTACGEVATQPISVGTGPQPTLPSPQRTLFPTVHIAPAQGWAPGAKPLPAADMQVTAFAGGLDHPRWLHVLPNRS